MSKQTSKRTSKSTKKTSKNTNSSKNNDDKEFIFEFGPDFIVNIGNEQIKKANTANENLFENPFENPLLHRKNTFYGDLESKLNIVLIKNYFDEEYADKLFNNLKHIHYNSDEESMIRIMGKRIKIPRKQTAFGEPNTTYHFSGINVAARDWTIDDGTIDSKVGQELEQICKRVGKTACCTFNYTLINNYINQTNSIGYHSDDERELGQFPVVAGLSLGEEREIYFKSKITKKVIKILLPHNSLVIMHYPTNRYWEHSIPKTARPLGQRISLTFRSVDEKLKQLK